MNTSHGIYRANLPGGAEDTFDELTTNELDELTTNELDELTTEELEGLADDEKVSQGS